MPQCSIGGSGGDSSLAQSQAQARSSFVDKIHGITDKLQHSLGGHLTHDPSKTGKCARERKARGREGKEEGETPLGGNSSEMSNGN